MGKIFELSVGYLYVLTCKFIIYRFYITRRKIYMLE